MYNLAVTLMAFLMKVTIYADSWKTSLPGCAFRYARYLHCNRRCSSCDIPSQ